MLSLLRSNVITTLALAPRGLELQIQWLIKKNITSYNATSQSKVELINRIHLCLYFLCFYSSDWLIMVSNHYYFCSQYFRLYFNIVRSCGRLVLPEFAKVYLPCCSTFGSTCSLGCMDGYVAFGNNTASCRLVNSSEVVWDIGNFKCKGLYVLYL